MHHGRASDLNHFHRQSLEKKRYAALSKWTEALEAIHGTVVGKTASVGRHEPGLMGPEGLGIPIREGF